jgi:hypothetical protein
MVRTLESYIWKLRASIQPSGRHVIPSGRPSIHYSIRSDDVSSLTDARQISIIRPDKVFVPSGPRHCIEKVLPSLHPSGRFSRTSGCLSVLDQFHISFQVPRKGRSFNRPDDVVSRPDACLLKARITIQISRSGRHSALVRTRVQLIWKLPIRLQPSGRLPLMVWTRSWKLRVEEFPFGRSSPMVRTRKALYGNYLQRTCDRPDVSVSRLVLR